MPNPTTFAHVMNPQSPRLAALSIEPLESRIAPAIIFVGNPNVNDTEYNDDPFINTEGSSDPIALKVGPGQVGVDDTFILKLSAGDIVRLFAIGGDSDLITVQGGKAVAFFIDQNQDHEVQATELVGFSLGPNASVTVKGTVYGDVVTNLITDGDGDLDLTGVGGTGGLVSPTQNLANFQANDVIGKIMVGGKINRLTAGEVGSVLTGNAADGETFDFFPGVSGGDGTLAVTAAAGQAGPSIQNVLVKGIVDRIEAGGGGAGGKGGSISKVQVTSDSDGFLLAAGNGGAGDTVAGKINGGAGGSISNVFISGFDDATPNSALGTRVVAGHGGNAAADSTGKGGVGGNLTKVMLGYDLRNGQSQPSANVSQDGASLIAGDGGNGKVAGKGGNITSSLLRVSVVDDINVVGPEVVVHAGVGGNAFSAGKAGAGGSISSIDIQNLNPIVTGSIISIQGGDGGTSAEDASGAAGGAVSKVTILGEGILINAGNGSSGKTGGKGGNVQQVTTVLSETVTPRDVTINSGIGGNAVNGNAGAGGSISSVLIGTADFTNFTINGGTAGNGGTSTVGRGGAGGSAKSITVLEIPLDTPVEGNVAVRAGVGGDGSTGGGVGGSLQDFLFSGVNVNVAAAAGAGGSATTAGNGANGGNIKSVRFSSFGQVSGASVTGSISAGVGGAGKGTNGSGGIGGSVTTANLNVDGDLTVTAGNGGNGDGGASGRGGSIVKTGGFSLFGSGAMIAGEAGLNGAKPGLGGSITSGTSLRAISAISIIAGAGHHGGAGGNISSVNFSSSSTDPSQPAPVGDVIVQAGNGSAEGNISGKGGSINQLIGYASGADSGNTTFTAGTGGGGAKSAAGGSITNLQILGGGGNGGVVTVTAGDAGDGTASVGANGGEVSNIEVAGFVTGTIFRSIAAGNGGDGTTKGGKGGSVQHVSVQGADIGDRHGGNFGYLTMGGIFAGLGGTGTTNGLNGSVIDIKAEAIASIVAGRDAVPGFVEKVDKITVGTSNQPVNLLRVEQGDFTDDGGDPDFGTVDPTAYDTNNFIGFYHDPTITDVNKFQFTDNNLDGVYGPGDTPLDGLIQAKVINLKTFNVTPEAYLTSEGFFDFNNRLS